MNLKPEFKAEFDEALDKMGLRPTRQREHVYGVILEKRDHPTAEELYARAKETMPTISLATVYNCLETLVQSGLVRSVNFDREPTRFCPNLKEHAHFHCEKTGRVYDVHLPSTIIKSLQHLLPQGFRVQNFELSFSGEAPAAEPTAPKPSETNETAESAN